MNRKKLSLIVTGLALSFLLTTTVPAVEKGSKESAEMQAQMAKMKEAATPGAEHAILKSFEGNWETTSRSWMKPGDQPQQSSGSSSLSWTLDGRFLQQNFKGNWAGQPFTGLGFIGYDKVKKEYVSVWLDNMSTGIFQATGQYDAASKTIKDSGTFSCPMSGEKEKWFRAEWKIINKNHQSYTMYTKDPSGKEFKTMEIMYKRLK